MSFAIDLGEYGHELEKDYKKVISSDPETTWTIFGYDGSSNAVKPKESGSGDLDEFVEAFDDSQIEYGFVRVDFNGINKIVLVGFCGENVSARRRLIFNSHLGAVAKQFSGHHIQITALSSDELSPEIILERVSAAAGSKYTNSTKKAPATKPRYVKVDEGANEDDWGESAPVDERELGSGGGGSYKSSAREELLAFRKESRPAPKAREAASKSAPKNDPTSDSEGAFDGDVEKETENGITGLDSSTSYQPVGKIDLKAIRAEGKNSKFADARIEKIESSYKPVGKVDIKAIREQARKEKQLKAGREVDSTPAKPEKSNSPVKKTPAKAPASEEDDDWEKVSKSEFTSEATESQYSAPNRRAEYGVGSKPAPRPTSDEDEPQFTSLADRMKAFQQSVSSAKPTPSRKAPDAEGSSKSGPKVASKSASKNYEDSEEEEEEGPVSVAAQLAKARLSAKEESEDSNDLKSARQASYGIKKEQPREEPEEEPAAPKAAVSTFAARFAKKEPKEEPKEDKFAEEEEPEEAPSPPRRVPQPPKEPSPPATIARAAEESEEDGDDALSAVVIQDYVKDDDDEISLTVDELVSDIQKVDENWWIGKNAQGDVGLFPADYVKVAGENQAAKEPATSEEPIADEEPATTEESAAAADEDDDGEKIAVALYRHEPSPEDEDELSLEENEKIVVLDFTSDDWWTGKNTKGEVGLFPATYVKLN